MHAVVREQREPGGHHSCVLGGDDAHHGHLHRAVDGEVDDGVGEVVRARMDRIEIGAEKDALARRNRNGGRRHLRLEPAHERLLDDVDVVLARARDARRGDCCGHGRSPLIQEHDGELAEAGPRVRMVDVRAKVPGRELVGVEDAV